MGRDHIFLLSHDEAPCYVMKEMWWVVGLVFKSVPVSRTAACRTTAAVVKLG
jgi:hypothetical protein